jgi:hypothetical protein
VLEKGGITAKRIRVRGPGIREEWSLSESSMEGPWASWVRELEVLSL